MTSSLVGSEMCIRDRVKGYRLSFVYFNSKASDKLSEDDWQQLEAIGFPSVSYTHLTLPTICSV
eukprot:11896573-Prorocentrum_lima.AAC.1